MHFRGSIMGAGAKIYLKIIKNQHIIDVWKNKFGSIFEHFMLKKWFLGMPMRGE